MSEFGNLARYLDKLADDIDAQAEHVDRLADKIALLESQRDALLAACKAVEWTEYWDGGVSCPQCGHGFRLDHNPNCQLAAAIAMTEGNP